MEENTRNTANNTSCDIKSAGDSNSCCKCSCHNKSLDVQKAARAELDDKYAQLVEASDYLSKRTKHKPRIAVICGTGLGDLADLLTQQEYFPYQDIPHFAVSTVEGHVGRLVFGLINNTLPVVCMQGRVHAYEGHSMWKVSLPVRVFERLGVRLLLVTNAAGGLNSDYNVGDIMIIKDHISLPSLVGVNSFVGPNDDRFGVRFQSLSGAYDKELRKRAREAAVSCGLSEILREGVYCCQLGPCFETIAENRMIRTIGADAIGMSTVFEVATARHVSLRVLGLTLITNLSLLDYETDCPAMSHDETLATGRMRAEQLKQFVQQLLPLLDKEID